MDDNNQRPMQQQDGNGQAHQPGQQNQQADNRPPQQPETADQTAPSQQNQQADRQPRSGEGIEGSGEDGLNSELEGGVDTGSLEPGRTGDGGAER